MKNAFVIIEQPRVYDGIYRGLYDRAKAEYIDTLWFGLDRTFDIYTPSRETLREKAADLIADEIEKY